MEQTYHKHIPVKNHSCSASYIAGKKMSNVIKAAGGDDDDDDKPFTTLPPPTFFLIKYHYNF